MTHRNTHEATQHLLRDIEAGERSDHARQAVATLDHYRERCDVWTLGDPELIGTARRRSGVFDDSPMIDVILFRSPVNNSAYAMWTEDGHSGVYREVDLGGLTVEECQWRFHSHPTGQRYRCNFPNPCN